VTLRRRPAARNHASRRGSVDEHHRRIAWTRSPELIERWMDDGRLPRLARLRAQGAFGACARSRSIARRELVDLPRGRLARTHRTLDAQRAGFPQLRVQGGPATTSATTRRSTATPRTPHRAVRLPLARSSRGCLAWQVLAGPGGEPVPAVSEPPELMERSSHGTGPTRLRGLGDRRIGEDGGPRCTAFATRALRRRGARSARARADRRGARARGHHRRPAIRERWDLLLAAYGETHIAGTCCGIAGCRTAERRRGAGPAGMPALAELLARSTRHRPDRRRAAAGATLVVFSVSGMRENAVDLPNTLFLPRRCTGCSSARDAVRGRPGTPRPRGASLRAHWKDEVWALRTAYGEQVLASPARWSERRRARLESGTLVPAALAADAGVRAAHLPAGTVRLNVRGARVGVVEPRDYGAPSRNSRPRSRG